MKYSYCSNQRHLINQGIHWCEKQVKGYPECCNENCPYREEVTIESLTTYTASNLIVEANYEASSNNKTNKRRKETNKTRKKTCK